MKQHTGSNTPLVYQWIYELVGRLARQGVVVENYNFQWRQGKRYAVSATKLAHQMRQIERREKRKALRALHLEISGAV